MSRLTCFFNIFLFKNICGYILKDIISISCVKINESSKISKIQLFWEGNEQEENFMQKFQELISPEKEIQSGNSRYSVIAPPVYEYIDSGIKIDLCICEFKI